MTTLLPRECRMSAVCRPMPETPPVMRAVFPRGDVSWEGVIVKTSFAKGILGDGGLCSEIGGVNLCPSVVNCAIWNGGLLKMLQPKRKGPYFGLEMELEMPS